MGTEDVEIRVFRQLANSNGGRWRFHGSVNPDGPADMWDAVLAKYIKQLNLGLRELPEGEYLLVGPEAAVVLAVSYPPAAPRIAFT